MNSKCKTLMTIVITALIAGGGVYMWQNSAQETSSETTPEETVSDQTESQSDESAEDESVTYTWTEYGIAFDYPAGWNVYETSTNVDGEAAEGLIFTASEVKGDTGGGFEIEVYAVTHQTLEERVDSLSSLDSFEDAGDVEIGDHTFRLVYYDVFTVSKPRYLIESDGILYVFATQSESIVKETLESLRFL